MSDTEIDLTKPRPRKPQDRKPKADAPFSFTAGGKKHTLPKLSEDAALSIPGGIVQDAVMNPDDDDADLRFGFALLEVASPDPAARAALRSLPFGEMRDVIAEWLGESRGSSE